MNIQFKKGVLDLVLLHLINESPLTAYDVVERLSNRLEVSANTIYPLLRRLEKDDYLTHEKRPSSMGAPKKVFTLTEQGKEHYTALKASWLSFQQEVNALLGGDSYDKNNLS